MSIKVQVHSDHRVLQQGDPLDLVFQPAWNDPPNMVRVIRDDFAPHVFRFNPSYIEIVHVRHIEVEDVTEVDDGDPIERVAT